MGQGELMYGADAVDLLERVGVGRVVTIQCDHAYRPHADFGLEGGKGNQQLYRIACTACLRRLGGRPPPPSSDSARSSDWSSPWGPSSSAAATPSPQAHNSLRPMDCPLSGSCWWVTCGNGRSRWQTRHPCRESRWLATDDCCLSIYLADRRLMTAALLTTAGR